MIDFKNEHMNMVEEYCSKMMKLERAIFINTVDFTQEQKDLLSSYSIAMLYSIWEGFVTRSFRKYIIYINEQKIPYDELIDSILVYSMESKFKQFKSYPEKESKKTRFFRALYSHCQSAQLEVDVLVDTEDNVSFEVLNKLMKIFGLTMFPEYWDIYVYPNINLKDMMTNFLRYRNAIAHGSDMSNEEVVSQDVYEKYRTMIRNLMYAMHEEFINGIKKTTYKKL